MRSYSVRAYTGDATKRVIFEDVVEAKSTATAIIQAQDSVKNWGYPAQVIWEAKAVA